MQGDDETTEACIGCPTIDRTLVASATPLATSCFPEWIFVNGAPSIVTLSEDNLKTITRKVHSLLKPYLLADLLRRHPGECASADHTFRMAARAKGDASALSFFMGELHDIYWYGAVTSTAWVDLIPALVGTERRFVRLGVSGKLKYWWDDLCCSGMGADKLHLHPVALCHPAVDRCPFKDGFHAVQLCTGATNGGSGDIDRYSRDISQRLLPVVEADVELIAGYLQRERNVGQVEARRIAMADYRGEGQIRTFRPQVDELVPIWEAGIDKWRLDRMMKGHASVVRSQTANFRGTLEQMMHMLGTPEKLGCIRKGCYSDPMAVDCMYTPYARGVGGIGLKRLKKSESVKNETVHKGGNKLVADISSMGEDLLECRLDMFVFKHNYKNDLKLGRVDRTSLGMPAEEALINRLASGVLASSPFPLAASRDTLEPITPDHPHYEPVGFDYYKVVRSSALQAIITRVQRQRAAWSTVSSKAAALALPIPPAPTEAPSSSSSSQRGRQGSQRASAVAKAPTRNLLNHEFLTPTTEHEIALMFQCVEQARAAPQKGTVWARAETLYATAFAQNCAVDEAQRKHVRGPASAAQIQAEFERLAQQHRAAQIHAESHTGVDVARSTVPGIAGFDGGALISDSAAAAADADASVDAKTSLKKSTPPKPSSAQRWKRKVESERLPLDVDGLKTLSGEGMRAYLSAMAITVPRLERKPDRMRELLCAELERCGGSWAYDPTDTVVRARKRSRVVHDVCE